MDPTWEKLKHRTLEAACPSLTVEVIKKFFVRQVKRDWSGMVTQISFLKSSLPGNTIIFTMIAATAPKGFVLPIEINSIYGPEFCLRN